MGITSQCARSKCAHVVFALLVAVLLAGCAARTPARLTLEAGEGAIVFKVVADARERNSTTWAAASNLELALVESAETPTESDEAETKAGSETEVTTNGVGKSFVIAGRLDATRGTFVYNHLLKAGRYKVLAVQGRSPLLGARRISLKGVFDTVEVREGEVTFLGTLLIRPERELLESDKRNVSRAVALGYVPPSAELIESFEQHSPALATQVKGKPVRVIELTPELNEATRIALQLKRRGSVAINGLWQDEKGNFFAGSRLGKVLLKHAGQPSWSQFDVGSWDEVTTVRPYRGGLLAGGEDGLLRFSSDGGSTWRSLSLPRWGHVQHLEVMPNGMLLMLIRTGAQWSAHVSEDALAGAWQKVGDLISADQVNLIRGSSANVVNLGYPPTTVLHEGAIFLTEYGSKSIVKMDTRTGRVELLPPPPLGVLHGMTKLPGGVLVLNGAFLKNATFTSSDDASSWTEVKTRGFLTFRNDLVGYSLYGPDFAITRDGGKTWVYPRKSATWTVEQLRYFEIDRSDGALVAVLFNGAVFRSRDEGGTWLREH